MVVKMSSFQELVDWARGYVLIEIGAGKFKDAMWYVVDRAWHGGLTRGQDLLLKELEDVVNKGASLRTIRTAIESKRKQLDKTLSENK